jgi:hypothetical protein
VSEDDFFGGFFEAGCPASASGSDGASVLGFAFFFAGVGLVPVDGLPVIEAPQNGQSSTSSSMTD